MFKMTDKARDFQTLDRHLEKARQMYALTMGEDEAARQEKVFETAMAILNAFHEGKMPLHNPYKMLYEAGL